MTDSTYEAGNIYRDPSLEVVSIRVIDDARLGKLCRAMGKVASDYLEQIREKHGPNLLSDLSSPRQFSAEDLEKRVQDSEKFNRRLNTAKEFIGRKIMDIIGESNRDPQRMAMYSKTAVFRDGEPVLYYEHWGTTDLDDSDRDPVEIQMFVGLNKHAETDVGKKLVDSVLGDILDENWGKMSPKDVPSEMSTLGTIPKELFEPFIRQETSSPQ